ncbi:MAG: hypothetical protein ACP5G1_04660 [Nanopusillaceae archaeon]
MAKEELNKISKGILDSLQDAEDITLKEYKSKKVNKAKSKRSFMLTDEQIRMLYELKLKFLHEDLSTILGKAIENYYNSNKKA